MLPQSAANANGGQDLPFPCFADAASADAMCLETSCCIIINLHCASADSRSGGAKRVCGEVWHSAMQKVKCGQGKTTILQYFNHYSRFEATGKTTARISYWCTESKAERVWHARKGVGAHGVAYLRFYQKSTSLLSPTDEPRLLLPTFQLTSRKIPITL